MNRKHKKHRSLSPPEEDSHRKSKNGKRHYNESSSDEEDHRKNSQKHQKHRHHSNDEDDKKLARAHRRKESHQKGRDAKFDPNLRIKQEKDDENFQQQQRERSRNDADRRTKRREREQNDGDFGLNTAPIKSEQGDEKKEDKQKPNFKLSGKLTEDTNTFRGVVIKYNEPPEAMKPKRRWRLYPFKGEEALPVLHIHRQSAYLLGRDRKIADIPVDHPSCSKQQAVLQFRAMPYTRPDGTPGRRVRPYIIDLESSNGTYLNNEKIEPRRYYELREKDVIKFGFSTREYVVLHDSVDLSEVTAGEDMEEV